MNLKDSDVLVISVTLPEWNWLTDAAKQRSVPAFGTFTMGLKVAANISIQALDKLKENEKNYQLTKMN